MSTSSTNAIKALVQRFLSLPLQARMQLTKKLLELYSSNQSAGGIGANFLEEFWDEVEEAHAGGGHAANPFREERRARARQIKAAPEAGQQGVYLPLIIHHSKLLPLL